MIKHYPRSTLRQDRLSGLAPGIEEMHQACDINVYCGNNVLSVVRQFCSPTAAFIINIHVYIAYPCISSLIYAIEEVKQYNNIQ